MPFRSFQRSEDCQSKVHCACTTPLDSDQAKTWSKTNVYSGFLWMLRVNLDVRVSRSIGIHSLERVTSSAMRTARGNLLPRFSDGAIDAPALAARSLAQRAPGNGGGRFGAAGVG